jgi:GNAT superfamily N-acetyltransferase
MDKRHEVAIETVTSYSSEVATGIGLLMPSLNDHLTAAPIAEDLLRGIIENPDREQFIARIHDRIVGAATLNMIYGVVGKKAWLEDFVTSEAPEVRGSGVGYKLWGSISKWCEERVVDLRFTSNPNREVAHRFYARQGAIVVPTTVFLVPLRSK